MDRIPPPSSAYPTPGSAGPVSASDHLAPFSARHNGRIWSLQVVQQPIRARMCGFGDKVGRLFRFLSGIPVNLQLTNLLFSFLKDRRPITPPPCVRLIVQDEQTGKEIDIKYAYPSQNWSDR